LTGEGRLTLVLGGARSGKSAVAEALARRAGTTVTYVATLTVGDDAELAARVEAHRARRPAHWRTLEAGPDLAGSLRAIEGTLLLDSLGPWVASHAGPVPTEALCAALTERPGHSIVVSDEVGLGVHPMTEIGRQFRDELGTVNQAVAAVADHVLLVVAGRALALDAVAGP
jgi:adenosyl cobinamide kinase/adenosyl cobinamide phosphate guanylyltransferase